RQGPTGTCRPLGLGGDKEPHNAGRGVLARGIDRTWAIYPGRRNDPLVLGRGRASRRSGRGYRREGSTTTATIRDPDRLAQHFPAVADGLYLFPQLVLLRRRLRQTYCQC